MPRHVIETRAFDPEEGGLRPGPHAQVESSGCAFVPIAIAAAIALGAGTVLYASVRALTRMSFVSFAAGLAVVLLGAGPARRAWRRLVAKRPHCRQAQEIEAIEVWDAIAVGSTGQNAQGLHYYLDIGEGKLLALAGPGLLDVPAYREGRPWPAEERFQPAEWAPPFLSSHFILHREARTGRVLRVDVLGEPIPLGPLPLAITPEADAQESRVIEGRIDDLSRVRG
jgi:hypothetical protein